MDFLKKLLFKDNTTQKMETIPEQSLTVSNDNQEDTSQNTLENFQSAPSSVNLMNKFFCTRKSSLTEPPEILHENEAWAPEPEFVGLFRKRRVSTKEHPYSSSCPQ